MKFNYHKEITSSIGINKIPFNGFLGNEAFKINKNKTYPDAMKPFVPLSLVQLL